MKNLQKHYGEEKSVEPSHHSFARELRSPAMYVCMYVTPTKPKQIKENITTNCSSYYS